MAKAWGIKLGSGGRCVTFCERHSIVGVGWKEVDAAVLRDANHDALVAHMAEVCTYPTRRERGVAAGHLRRFARECAVGDYILYYDPPRKHVRICRVASESAKRDFDLRDETDIWHYRRVEYPCAPIKIVDFPGSVKNSLMIPRSSFWEIRAFDDVDAIARGEDPGRAAAPDDELKAAYNRLRDLVVARARTFTETDWEQIVADYFRAQGAHIEGRVGGSRPVIDVEARFDHGALDDELWRIQVKRFQDRAVDWPTIEKDFANAGDARFCFVSVYGFTEEARQRASEEEILLLEAEHFVGFLLSGRIQPELRRKLALPQLG